MAVPTHASGHEYMKRDCPRRDNVDAIAPAACESGPVVATTHRRSTCRRHGSLADSAGAVVVRAAAAGPVVVAEAVVKELAEVATESAVAMAGRQRPPDIVGGCGTRVSRWLSACARSWVCRRRVADRGLRLAAHQ